MHSENELNKALLESIDQALNVLGEPVKKILYFHIDKQFCLKPDAFAEKPELFILATRQILGVGAKMVESLILKNLCKKLAVDYAKVEALTFTQGIEKIKQETCDCVF
jgi:hypothetical protein